jgi:hypothetical protein
MADITYMNNNILYEKKRSVIIIIYRKSITYYIIKICKHVFKKWLQKPNIANQDQIINYS